MASNNLLMLSIALFTCIPLSADVYDIMNTTDMPLSITWKSHGFGFNSKQGNFILSPGAWCKGCISTYNTNCVHILFIESLDKKYRLRSKPFCKSSRIILSLQESQKWFKKNKKELKITMDALKEMKESL